MEDPDVASLSLEERKWRAEQGFREREISLREREQSNRDAEVELNRREHAVSTWRSPVIVAIFAAAAGAFGNAVITLVNGSQQRELESTRRAAEVRSDKSKAESSRILEMIKTGDPEKAAANLEFLLKSGLVTDPDIVPKLLEFLRNRQPGSGPSLPRVGFEQSGALSPSLQNSLQAVLDRYFAYLDGLGFPSSPEKATIKITDLPDRTTIAFYQGDGTIVIDAKVADDPSIALREYNHHVLTRLAGRSATDARSDQIDAIESGIADYLACSFLDKPEVGAKAAEALHIRQPSIHNLSNDMNYAQMDALMQRSGAWYAGAQMWGGLLWEIRARIGRSAADPIIAAAWRKVAFPADTSRQSGAFIAVLQSEASSAGPQQRKLVDTVLARRGFSF